jgi:hypothetical protein
MPAKNTVARPRTAKPATGPPKQRLCRRVLSRPVSLRRHIWPGFYRFPLLSRFHTVPLLPPHLMQLGPVLTFLGPYRSHPSSSLTRRLASTSAASAAACTISRRCRRAPYSSPSSQWAASSFMDESSHTNPVRSRIMSLATSFGFCGPI